MRHDVQATFWDALDVAPDQYSKVRDMRVDRASKRDVDEFCRRWHYSSRGGSAAWNYGVWDGHTLAGVASYNLPTMDACAAVFGPERWEWVAHLGRLVCAEDAPRNIESKLIARSLRLLKIDRPVVRAVLTFAAPSAGHLGYVYQATNALYLGKSMGRSYFVDQHGARRSDSHSSHTIARSRGWEVVKEVGKHRYLYLVGSRSERKEARRLLKHDVLAYPKSVD